MKFPISFPPRMFSTVGVMLLLAVSAVACDAAGSYDLTVNLPVAAQEGLAMGENYDVILDPHHNDSPYAAVAWRMGTFCLQAGEDKTIERRLGAMNEEPATHFDIYLVAGESTAECVDSEHDLDLRSADELDVAPPIDYEMPNMVLGVVMETYEGQANGQFVADVTFVAPKN